MAEKILLKDLLFNPKKVEQIAKDIHKAYPAFERESFVKVVVSRFPELELKARISWIAECLRGHLPSSYKEAVDVLLRSLPVPCDPSLGDDDFGDFIYASYTEFVARYGCDEKVLALSLKALKEMTTRFSAEDAIRYFINAYPAETMGELKKWSEDTHYHVRRLCSEGTRPKLPWSAKIRIAVTEPLPILHKLHADRTRYVTRSVANHLNDISKTSPELVLETLAQWKRSGKQKPDELDFMVRHSLRTLIKSGHPKAMQLLGFVSDAKVNLSDLQVPKKVKLGHALEFSIHLKALQETRVIVDYIIYFQNKAGKLAGPKVFKLRSCTLPKNEKVIITKSHPFRKNMTTRTLYPGRHEIAIQINGRIYKKVSFNLIG